MVMAVNMMRTKSLLVNGSMTKLILLQMISDLIFTHFQNKLLSFSLRQDFLEVTATILPKRAFLTFIWKQVFGAMMTEQAAMMKHI